MEVVQVLSREQLHGYQTFASDFIIEHPASAILLDCGCGKTIITLTAIKDLLFDRFEVQKVLVICPIRVAAVWAEEIEKWEHLQGLRLSICVGTASQRRNALEADSDIYVINRDVVPWLVENYSGSAWKWDMLVIDELSSFKNSQAKRFKSLLKMRPKVKRIVGLTGTPSSNGLMDLWAEYRLLDLGERLGRFIGAYRAQYFRPEKTNGMVVYSYAPLPGAEERIYKRISDMTVSLRCTDVLQMPELISVPYEVSMSPKEKQVYDSLKKDLVLGLETDQEITAANAAALSGKLTQIANGAVYQDDGEVLVVHDKKLDALEDIIEAQNGKPLLVAYWYRHDLERIEARLRKIGVGYSKIDTQNAIIRWNAKMIPVGLIHPASAGHGLNLQAGGSTLVWFGLTWSLELYIQTNARLWRQGQVSSTVVIQHIITKDTIDERILKALQKKEVTQDALMAAVKAELG
ncbi:MAG: DEAD/DEAH box helicase [Blautia sp.]|nr:DEAD/DEAH box helicase [Blautia sp.]